MVHVDEHAVRAITAYLSHVLPTQGAILDLMSSWRSHLPEEASMREVIGLGLNAMEMLENPKRSHHVVHDLNKEPSLPFPEASFEAALVTVSIQYLVHPLEVFAETASILKPGGMFHVIYSNRMFPTKAVAVWQASADEQRAALVTSYFKHGGPWQAIQALDVSPRLGFYTDPVFVVRAAKPMTA